MSWNQLTDVNQIEEISAASKARPQVILKHSTRCSISSVAWQRLQKATQPSGADFYFLDLLAHRSISNKIVEIFKVHHESPQVLIIKNGECTFDESHLAISMNDIAAEIM